MTSDDNPTAPTGGPAAPSGDPGPGLVALGARRTEGAGGAEDAPARDTGVEETEEDAAALLAAVQRDIEVEVRRRRAAGDFPPSFERKLDELFARFTPTGTGDDHFTEALKLADRSAYFDVKVPIGSRRTAKGAVRFALWQAEAWFVSYVVTQLNHFSSSTMRVLHLLDERVEDLEREVGALTPPPLPGDELTVPGVDPTPFLAGLGRAFADDGEALRHRRVLHAECGDGTVLSHLAALGVDAYGIDPGGAAADDAAAAGLDVRRDDVLDHLRSVATESLRGVVLSGCVDRLTLADRRELARRAETAVADGGVVAVIGTSPAAWATAAGPVGSDLAPGRPLHHATWSHLLHQVGLHTTEVLEGPVGWAAPAVPDDHPGAGAHIDALARIEQLFGGPGSYAVIARKPTAGAAGPHPAA